MTTRESPNNLYARVSLIFEGDDLKFEGIRKWIGVCPANEISKGTIRRLTSGTQVTAPTGSWIYKLKSEVLTANSLLNQVLNLFPDDFSSEHEKYGIDKIRIAVYSSSNNDLADLSIDLEHEAISTLAKCGASVNITFSIVTEGD